MKSSFSQAEENMPVVDVAKQDRWQIRKRLLELSIPAVCSSDGNLYVDVNSYISVLQVRSVLRQFQYKRADLVELLEDCWYQPSHDCRT